MKPTIYHIKSGKYTGMWHVRIYNKGKYFHLGRFRNRDEAELAMENA